MILNTIWSIFDDDPPGLMEHMPRDSIQQMRRADADKEVNLDGDVTFENCALALPAESDLRGD